MIDDDIINIWHILHYLFPDIIAANIFGYLFGKYIKTVESIGKYYIVASILKPPVLVDLNEIYNDNYLYDDTIYKFFRRSPEICVLPFLEINNLSKLTLYECLLREFYVPKGVKRLGTIIFNNCPLLKKIVIPDSVEGVESFRVLRCNYISNIYLPDSIDNIKYYSFRGCQGLKSVHLPKNIYNLPSSCFYDCISLVYVILPKNISRISQSCFYNCVGLESITLSERVKRIDFMAFYGCKSLKNIKLESRYKKFTIDNYAFRRCKNLTNFDFCGLKIDRIKRYWFRTNKFIYQPGDRTDITYNYKSFPRHVKIGGEYHSPPIN